MAQQENIIVNLKINDDMIPYPYNENVLSYNNNSIDPLYSPVENDVNDENQNVDNKGVVYLLNEFKEKNKNEEWPSGTSVCCYWCCHSFQGPPMGIPIKYVNNKFEVFGCFCSLSCAAAYNFKSQGNLDEMWERYNLINALYRSLSNENTIVKPAPDRLALSMFGGRMDIDEFRKYTESEKIINVLFPPMIAVTQQIEELNEYDISNSKRYIPIDLNRINKQEEKMLRRSKPLVDSKNSIETFIELL